MFRNELSHVATYSVCYTRLTSSHKPLVELICLNAKVDEYLLVQRVLLSGTSSLATMTNELPIGVLWLLCVVGTRFARRTAQLSCPPLSLPSELSESKPAT
jgi:hypothetical protein